MDSKREELKKKIEEANKIYRNMITGNIFDVNKSFENLLTPEKQIKKEMDLLSKSIKNVQNSIQDGLLEDIQDKYIDRYSDIAQNLSEKKEFLETSIDLTSLGKEINNEIYKYKMDDINHREKLFHDFEHAKPIEFRNYAHEMLEEFKIQNEKLSTVIEHLKTQNESLDIQIKQDKASSEKQIYKLQEQIESNNLASKNIIDENKETANQQIQLLKEQIDKSDVSFAKQLKDSRKSMKWTIGIAVVSIAIAIGSTIWSANKTEEIYNKENISSDEQHKEIKEILKNNSNKNLNSEEKQLKVLNQIFESMNNKRISK